MQLKKTRIRAQLSAVRMDNDWHSPQPRPVSANTQERVEAQD
ncbi:MAG TPA: hypothetical protein VFV66_20245 [Nonomuraea sp.]|nr:hypothetical protein [Nonomuraea sp.]